MEKKPVTQEIDLLKLLASIYRIIRKNIVLVILCPGIGLLLGFFFTTLSNKPTLSNHSAHSNLLITSELLSENEANYLAMDMVSSDSLPGLTKDDKSKITNLNYEVKKEYVTKEKSEIFIKISVSFTNAHILPKLQNALITYLNNSEPVASRWKSKERFYNKVVKKFDQELEQLESLKTEKQITSKAEIHLAIADLYERRGEYLIASENRPIRLVKGFSSVVPNIGISSPKLPYLLLGFIGGVTVLFLILFIRHFKNYYKHFEQEQ